MHEAMEPSHGRSDTGTNTTPAATTMRLVGGTARTLLMAWEEWENGGALAGCCEERAPASMRA